MGGPNRSLKGQHVSLLAPSLPGWFTPLKQWQEPFNTCLPAQAQQWGTSILVDCFPELSLEPLIFHILGKHPLLNL